MELPVHLQDVPLCVHCNATCIAPKVSHSGTALATQIRQNHIPSTFERGEISKTIREAEGRLAQYDEELNRLRGTAQNLQRQREALQAVVDGYRCLQAPIRRLPTELLHDVFSLAESDDLRSSFYSEDMPTPQGLAPLNLSRVCSRWRAIVLGSAQLWSVIDVAIDDQELDPRYGNTHALETHIERSGTMPLCITLTSSDYFPHHPHLRILAQTSRRWHRADLTLSSEYYFEGEELTPIRGNLPILQELRFGEVLGGVGDLFALCPRLNHLDILYMPSEDLNVPWEQLISVHIEEPVLGHNSAHIEVLRRCPQIAQYDIQSEYPVIDPVDDGRIVVSNIKSLTISVVLWVCENDPGYLDALSLPHLQSFQLDITQTVFGIDFTSKSLLKDILSFARRSSFSLQSLVLNYVIMKDTELLELLRSMPTLKELRLAERSGEMITAFLMSALTLRPEHAPLNSPPSSSLDPSPAPLLPGLTKG